jgi:predicted protein tyrosine phosphatase
MKKGKTSKIQGFKTAKVLFGTVDSVNLKSIYLNIQTWVEPKKDVENWSRVVLNFSRSIKHSIYDKIKNSFFDDKFIVDLDLRSSGLSLNKKSFMNLEINFFLKDNVELTFKDTEIKDFLKNLTTKIFQENLKNNQYFKFYLSKTNKPINQTVKTENI